MTFLECFCCLGGASWRDKSQPHKQNKNKPLEQVKEAEKLTHIGVLFRYIAYHC